MWQDVWQDSDNSQADCGVSIKVKALVQATQNQNRGRPDHAAIMNMTAHTDMTIDDTQVTKWIPTVGPKLVV